MSSSGDPGKVPPFPQFLFLRIPATFGPTPSCSCSTSGVARVLSQECRLIFQRPRAVVGQARL